MKISIVIPIYQSAETLFSLVEELINALPYDKKEIMLINDGSTDNSDAVCRLIHKKHSGIVKYLSLTKNFGEHNAVLAGLNYATGDYALVIDDDFQNPPEEISKLVDEAVAGNFDVVYGVYDRKYHPWHRNLGSEFNNLVATFLLAKPIDLYLSSFKCLNRFTINEIIKYKGPFPYIDGLILRTTRNIGKVLVRHEKRKQGESGYTLKKLLGLWLNMFINFSVFPLRVSTLLGFLFSILGGLFAIFTIIEKITHPNIPVGFASILVSILIFSGIQLIILGLIGEYVGKHFLACNQMPQYVIRQILADETKEAKHEK